MSNNFFLDNSDLQFRFDNAELAEIFRLKEDDYTQKAMFPEAPASLKEALDVARKRLEEAGALSAEVFEPHGTQVDRDNVHLAGGHVDYPFGTQENLAAIREHGLCGVTLPRKYNGLNLPTTVYSMMTEMVSRADASLQNLFGLQSIAETLYRFGSDEQRDRMLPRFASGDVDGAMALTEPEAGSDLQSVQTRATFDPETGKWFINGKKRFITNGRAKALLVLARSEEGTTDGRGLSMFLVEACPQLKISGIEDKLGIHGSPTCELTFDNVPAELVGSRKMGLIRYVMSLMNGARLAIASQAVGIAEAAYRCASDYAASRRQFGKSINQIGAVSAMLVKMRTAVLAGRALLYETSRVVDLRDACEDRVRRGVAADDERLKVKEYGRLADVLTPMTKAFNTEMCNKVAYDGIQVHGGKGYMRDHLAERYFRDARITNIYEGTTQLQVVAAIAGVKKRTLVPRLDELSALPLEGKAAELMQRFNAERPKVEEAIAIVDQHNDNVLFFDQMAYHIVRMETIILIGMLLTRDCMISQERLSVAQEFAAEYLPEFEMNYLIVKNQQLPDTSILAI
ncbi:MAG: acyl-CoA dehydrogenase family protein [Lentisphaeria bacterium]|nr:acyl-CoA dehydrogenase family protein [Lentisphaeria bacterium]